MPPYVYPLMAHGIIGLLDVVINHEWLSKLPSRRECLAEERLHSTREFLFVALGALAWGVRDARASLRLERMGPAPA